MSGFRPLLVTGPHITTYRVSIGRTGPYVILHEQHVLPLQCRFSCISLQIRCNFAAISLQPGISILLRSDLSANPLHDTN